MRLHIARAEAIWTGTGARAAGLVIEDDRIAEVLAPGAAPAAPCEQVFDAGGLVILPGLINTQHHFFQTLTRACPAALNKALFDWLRALYPVWAGLDETCVRLSTQLAAAELLLSGCTLAADHHYVFNSAIERALDWQVEACQALGIRAVLTRGSMSLGHAQGGLPPDSLVQTQTQILQDSERLLQMAQGWGPGARIQLALAPCSPFSVTPELMRESAALARRYGALMHTHLAETDDETDFCLRVHGLRPLDYLEQVDWLAGDVWLAHGIHFTPAEIARLGAAKVGIAHCPSSNMLLASGVCPALALEAAGVNVGLGVDGSASNDSSNMIQEARQAFLLQRLHAGAGHMTHEDALRWATAGGARLFGRPDLGTLAPGNKADLACFSLDELRFSGHGDPVAALVLCGAHSARHVMVDGHWRVRDGAIEGLDLPALRAAHQVASEQLLRRLG